MGIFDSDFDIEDYIRKKIPELDELNNRELFKSIVGNLTLELYKHVKEEYEALEERVFSEAPKAENLPNLITCVVSQDEYDVTDDFMRPMFDDDLAQVKIDAQEMIQAVNTGHEFFLYTCMIQADYFELKKMLETKRTFVGTIENEYGETPAEFILKPNERYRKKAEELYNIAKLNFIPWRSINIPYLYKLFDVYVVKIEEWDDQLEVKKVTIEFDEFSEKLFPKPLPLWNIKEVVIKANSYPQPAVDRKYFEHYLYKAQFTEGHEYLLKNADTVIRNIRREDGDVYIICDKDLPGDWNFYEFIPEPNPKNYELPLMSNEKDNSFSRDILEYFGQRIKTRTELVRFLQSFKCSEYLSFADAKITTKPPEIETYSTEKFIDYEFRTGDRPLAFEISFRPKDEDFYLNRDIMSFFTTALQHLFPEYLCIGKLV
ncbi:MAG: hypothetical protein IJU55_05920 [Selenomonadaceae bacterium]|nr:hypothetical protein [Selenomonadaceae bacterium]